MFRYSSILPHEYENDASNIFFLHYILLHITIMKFISFKIWVCWGYYTYVYEWCQFQRFKEGGYINFIEIRKEQEMSICVHYRKMICTSSESFLRCILYLILIIRFSNEFFLKLQQKLILKIKLHNMCKISLYTRIEKNNSM